MNFKALSLNTSKTFIMMFLLCLFGSSLCAQNDTLVLKNKDLIVGEVKNLLDGILTVETSYSDSDFKIEFDQVKKLTIQRKCLIILTKGKRLFGNIKTDNSGNAVLTIDGVEEKHPLEDVIVLEEIKDNFWKRIEVAIDFGYNITKANNNKQITIGGKIEYTGQKWLIEGSINALDASQDNTDDTRRTDANLEFIRLLPKEWYLLGEVSFLSNTEQALDARITPSLGAGRLLISSNKLYLGLTAGLSYNIENYLDSSLDKTSSEFLIGSSFKIYNIEDIDLNTDITLYPSLSEKGRFRTDYNLVFKYDLPYDFYIKLSFTFNYDNQPAIVGNDFDYIIRSGLGWSFD